MRKDLEAIRPEGATTMAEPWRNGKRKLTDAQVVRAFRLRAAGETQTAIAERLGVGPKTISDILARRERRGVAVPAELVAAARCRPGHTTIPAESVVEAFRLASTGMTQGAIARRIGSDQRVVSAILRRRSRRSVAVPAEYLDHARRARGMAPGERNRCAVLREKDIEDIFRLARWGAPDAEIAAKFGVSPRAIDHVLARRTWKHVKVSPEYLPSSR